MKFDKTKVYTAVNADEVKIGSKGYFADTLTDLKARVATESADCFGEILHILFPDSYYCFSFKDTRCNYALFYLVEEPAPKEVTAEEWDNRPRLMKVWDDDYSESQKRRVVCIVPEEENVAYPVVSISHNITEGHIVCFKHCAEIAATKEVEKEKSYRPYKNADEFIADYKRRFCPDCKGIPAIWVRNVADTLKMVIAMNDECVKVDGKIDYFSLLDTYTYLDGTPCGIEE